MMNERIFELAEQANEYATTRHPMSNIALSVNSEKFVKKFAELILQEHVELLKQRWYTLNNAVPENNETPRDIGMRVGQKAEVMHCIHLLSNHWKDADESSSTERQ